MSVPLLIGIVGVGAIAYAVHLPVLKNIPDIQIVLVRPDITHNGGQK